MSRIGSSEGAGPHGGQADGDGMRNGDVGISSAKRGREASPEEHRAKRVKTEDVSEQDPKTDQKGAQSAEVRSRGRFRNPALDARRREKNHQAIARQAQSIGLVLASDFGTAIEGCFFSCVSHQYSLQAQDGSSTQASAVSNLKGASNLKQLCADWLLANQDTYFVPPPPLASSAFEVVEQNRDPDKVSTRNMTRSIASMVQPRTVDAFADKLTKDQERLTKETLKLIPFACCKVLNMRIAILQPSRRSDAMWELWEPGGAQDSGATEAQIVLTIAQPRPGSNLFESLVDKDSAPELIPGSDDESEEEENEPRAGAALESTVPLKWRRCDACSKIRWMLQDDHPDTEPWTCEQNIASPVEQHCEDAAVWNEILKFWNQRFKDHHLEAQKGQNSGEIRLRRFDAPNKTMAGKRMDLSNFFVAVQAFNTSQDIHHANGLQRLCEMRKAAPLVNQWLGVAANSKRIHTSNLKKIYEKVFVGSKLETILLAKPEVLETIQRHKRAILDKLEVDGCDELPRPQPWLAPVPLFQQPLTKRFSSDEVRKLLSRFRDNAATWLADHNQSAPWHAPLQSVVDHVQLVLHGGGANALILLGDTNIGKSRLLDLLLWISESDKNEYKKVLDSETRTLEADELLMQIKQGRLAARGMSNDAGSESPALSPADSDPPVPPSPDDPWQYVSFSVNPAELNDHVMGDILEKERQEQKSMCEISESNETLSREIRPYVLPVGNPITSTTACSVSVRRGGRWQVVLEYRDDVLDRWAKYGQIGREAKKARGDSQTRLERKRKLILDEVSKALGTSDTTKVKDFLLSISGNAAAIDRPEIRAEIPELLHVHGKSFALCGAGCSAIHDRIFARRVIHYAQGIPERDHNASLVNKTERSLGPPFLFFENDVECLDFGMKTHFCLKRITLICPCIIAPACSNDQRGLYDPCGSNDANELKDQSFIEAATHADAALVLVERSLTTNSTCEGLKNTKAMRSFVQQQALMVKRLARSASNDDASSKAEEHISAPVFLAVNHEKGCKNKYNVLPTIATLSDPGVEEIKAGSRSVSVNKLKDVATSVAKNQGVGRDDDPDDMDDAMDLPEQVGERVSAAIKQAFPCFFLFASLVLNCDSKRLSAKEREEALEQTDCYSMLGFIEQFLRNSSQDKLKGLISSVEAQLSEFEVLRDDLEMPGYPSRSAGRSEGSLTHKDAKAKEYQEWLESDELKQLENSIRTDFADFMQTFRASWKWSNENQDSTLEDSEPKSLMEELTNFLVDCRERDFDPFTDQGCAVLPPPVALGQNAPSEFRNLVSLLRGWWNHAVEDFKMKLAKKICNKASITRGGVLTYASAMADSERTFFRSVLERMSDFVKKRASELETRLQTQISEEQNEKIYDVLLRQVHARIKTDFIPDVANSVTGFSAGFDSAVQQMLDHLPKHEDLALEAKIKLLVEEDSGEAGDVLQQFWEAITKILVEKVKSLITKSMARPPPSTRLTSKKESKPKATRATKTGQEKQTSAIAESTADRLMKKLGFPTSCTAESGKGSRVNVLQRVCHKMVEVVNPVGLMSKAGEDRTRLKEVEDDMQHFLDNLRETQSEWSGGNSKRHDIVSMGREMTRRMLNLRLAEHIETGSGIPIPSEFDLTHTHDPLPEDQWVLFDCNKHLEQMDNCMFEPDHINKMVDKVLTEYKLKVGNFKRQDHHGSLFRRYAKILGMEDEDGVEETMCEIVRLMASKEASHGASPRFKLIQEKYETVEKFVEGLKTGTVPVDLLALTYLVDKTERPLNVYTPFTDAGPIRVQPSSAGLVRDAGARADAIVYFGRELLETSPDDQDDPSSLSSQISVGTAPPEVHIYHFVDCVPSASRLAALKRVSRQKQPASDLPAPSTHSRSGSARNLDAMDDQDDEELELVKVMSRFQQDLSGLEARLASNGLKLEDVPGDGNCQFHALAKQLARFAGDFDMGSDCHDVRRDVAQWLRKNAQFKPDANDVSEKAELRYFTTYPGCSSRNWKKSWQEYCDKVENKERSSTPLWGDNLTILAAANHYRRPVRVWLSPDVEPRSKNRVIAPSNSNCADAPFEIAHIHEVHYQSVSILDDSDAKPQLGPPELDRESSSVSFREFSKHTASDHEREEVSSHPIVQPASSLSELRNTLVTEATSLSLGSRDSIQIEPQIAYRRKYATFLARAWQQKKAEDGKLSLFYKPENWCVPEAEYALLSRAYPQFSESFVFMRGRQKTSTDPPKDYSRIRTRRGVGFQSCDDAVANSECMVCVADGVGEGEHLSGEFARRFTRLCFDTAWLPLPQHTVATNQKFNYSGTILAKVYPECCKDYSKLRADMADEDCWREKPDRSGKLVKQELLPSTTAVMLTLLKQHDKPRLHALVHGDSGWALLRRGTGASEYQTVYVSPALFYAKQAGGRHKGRNDVQRQILGPRGNGNVGMFNGMDPPDDPMTEEFDVQENDVVVVATDGFFDNCNDGGTSGREAEPALKERLATMLNSAAIESGEQGERKIVEAFGNCLAEFTKGRMKQDSGKHDDVTIFVGRINTHNAPCGMQATASQGDVTDVDGFTEVHTSGPSPPEGCSSAPSPVEQDAI